MKLKYRADIDGLRAIAVLSVVIYHFYPSLLPGGFLGVDVFFVLSGYLITKIISSEIHTGSFSFADFYLRRIKRILPSFFIVLLLTLLASMLLFEQADLNSVIKAAISSLFFASNVNFAIGLDYFSSNALEQPLLHFWSLSVEEQYYFIMPIIIILCFRHLRSNFVTYIFLFIFLSSIILATYLSYNHIYESMSYYLLPTRMYAMVLGSLIVLTKIDQKDFSMCSDYTVLLFIVLILSFFFLDKNFLFPGAGGLLPIVCVAGIIIFGNKGNSSSYKLLTLPFMVWIGKISYTLYLVHWPVMSFARYILMRSEFSFLEFIILSCVILSLTLVIYYGVENKARFLKLNFKHAFFKLFVLPTVVTFILISSSYLELLSVNRAPNVKTYDSGLDICHNQNTQNCFIGNNTTESAFAFIGDSHAAQYAYFLKEYSARSDNSFFLRSSSSCPIIPTWSSKEIKNINIRNRCDDFKGEFEAIYDRHSTIYISQKWDSYLNEEVEVEKLKNYLQGVDKNKVIYLVTQLPSYKYDVLRAYRYDKPNVKTQSYKLANQRLFDLADNFSNVKVLNTAKHLETVESGVVDGVPLYRDSHHINVIGAKYLVSKFLGDSDESN